MIRRSWNRTRVCRVCGITYNGSRYSRKCVDCYIKRTKGRKSKKIK